MSARQGPSRIMIRMSNAMRLPDPDWMAKGVLHRPDASGQAASATRKPKAAFIKYGNFSHANTHVLTFLTTGFPEFEVETIDVRQDLGKDVLAALHCLKEYG